MIDFIIFYVIASYAIIFGLFVLLLWALSKYSRSRREYGVKSVTSRGEEVKSIAEKRIADYFAKNNINYVYEQEAKTKGLIFHQKISNPDFYLPDHNIYVEYWGLVDADDRSTRARYVRNMKWKMSLYHKNNIRFISIYPDNLKNLDWIFRKKFRKVAGFELPS